MKRKNEVKVPSKRRKSVQACLRKPKRVGITVAMICGCCRLYGVGEMAEIKECGGCERMMMKRGLKISVSENVQYSMLNVQCSTVGGIGI